MYTRFDKLPLREGRETILVREPGMAKGEFKVHVRKLVNGLLNSHGGVIYFGVDNTSIMTGIRINRKEEDDFRLAVDHTIGAFMPLVPNDLYRLTFLPLKEKNRVHDESNLKLIELKVSVGKMGEIYDDGTHSVYIIDTSIVIGPLHPQELRELILLKYKECMEGAEEVKKFATPNLAVARTTGRIPKSNLPITNVRGKISKPPTLQSVVVSRPPTMRSVVEYTGELF